MILLNNLLTPLCLQILVHLLFHLQNSYQLADLNSKLLLFRGRHKIELHGKECPVGISFVKPMRFSCACVTGVWAFYDEFCGAPFKIVGGINHCFQMPQNWVQQVTILSNPLKVLDPTLTIFDEDETAKLKIYRNTLMSLANPRRIVSHNSSWTLVNNKTNSKICLDGRREKNYEEIALKESLKFSFCHFQNIFRNMSEITSFKQGCSKNTPKLLPDKCQEYEETNDESFCSSPPILVAFQKILYEENSKNFIQPNLRKKLKTEPFSPLESNFDEGFESSNEIFEDFILNNSFISSKELFNNGLNGESLRRKKGIIGQLAHASKIFIDFPYVVENKNRGENNLKINESANNDEIIESNAIFVDFTDKKTEESENFTQNEVLDENMLKMIEKMKIAGANEGSWLEINKSDSNPLVLSQILMHQKQTILSLLDLKANDENYSTPSSQFIQLLNVSKNIMGITCRELVPKIFFEMAMETFINVQRKNLNWKPPFIDNYDFRRIIKSLNACLSRAQPFKFKKQNNCLVEEPKEVFIKGRIKEIVTPESFKSIGFEPIIESIWKIIVNAHSYCYQDFTEHFNDHHLYATLFTPIFTNGIYQIWNRNKTIETEYNGVGGKMSVVLKKLEGCTVASRYVSDYPWDLVRPDIGNLIYSQKKRRRRRRDLRSIKIPVALPNTKKYFSEMRTKDEEMSKWKKTNNHNNNNFKISRNSLVKVPPTLATVTTTMSHLETFENEINEWKESRRIFNGLAYCLKKFDEPRTKLDQNCN